MKPAETIAGIGEGGNKREWWRVLIQVWYIWYIIRHFVNATMYPQHNNKKIDFLKMSSNHQSHTKLAF
jgi:hypothetical protein